MTQLQYAIGMMSAAKEIVDFLLTREDLSSRLKEQLMVTAIDFTNKAGAIIHYFTFQDMKLLNELKSKSKCHW